MKRFPTSVLVVGVLTLVTCAQAVAAVQDARGTMRASVVERAGIDIVSPLVLPTVSAATVASRGLAGAAGGVGASSAASNGVGNATLTIHGQAGDAVSMAVPESFRVVRDGGSEALTVQTNTNSEFGLSNDGVALGGTVMNGDTMSVNVGGNVNLASADGLVPGPYQGLLVVVVQYN